MGARKDLVLSLTVVCLSGCGKAEASFASRGRETNGEGDALAKLQSVTNDYVREVVEIIPDFAEVKDTIRQIGEARDKAVTHKRLFLPDELSECTERGPYLLRGRRLCLPSDNRFGILTS